MHSVLLLILIFLTSSLILFLMKIDFLGFAFIIIYVGAIAILFLFVIMMTNIKNVENISPSGIKFFIVVCSCAGLFFNQWSFFFYSKESLTFYTHVSHVLYFLYAFIHLNMYFFCIFSFCCAILILLGVTVTVILATISFNSASSIQHGVAKSTESKILTNRYDSKFFLVDLFNSSNISKYRWFLKKLSSTVVCNSNLKVAYFKSRLCDNRRLAQVEYFSFGLFPILLLITLIKVLSLLGITLNGVLSQLFEDGTLVVSFFSALRMWADLEFLYQDILSSREFYDTVDGKLVVGMQALRTIVSHGRTLGAGAVAGLGYQIFQLETEKKEAVRLANMIEDKLLITDSKLTIANAKAVDSETKTVNFETLLIQSENKNKTLEASLENTKTKKDDGSFYKFLFEKADKS